MEKKCKLCGFVGPLSYFIPKARRCKKCAAEYFKKWRENNKDALAKQQAEYRSRPEIKERRKARRNNGGAEKKYADTPRGRAAAMYHTCMKGAAERGLPFEITLDWVYDKFLTGRCEVTGIPFVFESADHKHTVKCGTQQRNPFRPSIDRKDSTKGYTADNAQIVVVMYNTCKGPFSDEALMEFCKAYLEKNDRP